MSKPSNTPNTEPQTAELSPRQERLLMMRRKNAALENTFNSRADEKHFIQAMLLIVEKHCGAIQEKCNEQFAQIVSPEMAEELSVELRQALTDAINDLRNDFLHTMNHES